MRVEGALVSNDIHLLRRAVEQGIGIAHLPMLIAEDMLAEGTAVPVLEDVIGGETQIAVVYPEKAYLSPVVRAFIDAVVLWAKDELVPRAVREARGTLITNPMKPRSRGGPRAAPRA